MKGEVATAHMPIISETRPMIHIPAGVVSEFMNSESSLPPVINSSKSSISVLKTMDFNLSSLNGITSSKTMAAKTASPLVKAVKDVEDKKNEAASTNGELSLDPLIGSIPPDSRPAKPASPAALCNIPNATQLTADTVSPIEKAKDLPHLSAPNNLLKSSSLQSTSDHMEELACVEKDSVTEDSLLLTNLPFTVATPVVLADLPDLPESTDITELSPLKPSGVSTSNSAATSNNLDVLLDVGEGTCDMLDSTRSGKKTPKRVLSSEDEGLVKKRRLSPNVETLDAHKKEDEAMVNKEVEKLKMATSKLRKLKRKDLENMIVDLFMNKILHSHEIGKYKSLCEKLEFTLEANRKKTAQFHKELEDLRKVTKKLQEEHNARKEFLVTPIKIKRSVGIQAAPHIIQKGIAAACGDWGKSGPRMSAGGSMLSQSNGHSSLQSAMTASANAGANQGAVMRTSMSGVRLGPYIPGAPSERRSLGTSVTSAGSKGSAVIDLTDEEETRAPALANSVTKTTQVVKASTSVGSAFVTMPASAGAQYVFVPTSANASGTTVVVSANMGSNSVGGANNTSPRFLLPGITSGAAPKPAVPVASQQQSPHPAQLPRTAPQQVVGGAKQLPPQPTLKLSHKENSIVLSWTMAKSTEHESIASYQLFAYQESNQPPSPNLWKKVGSVKALELPMACTLTQFMPGHRYHFAVRAVDAKNRLGPFSDPRSIRLEK
ncbi:activating transcription factor 7-interacting protein 2 [Hyalella azteca]|uniref:Activating transcription factor 7-interacting protein 2 n=1 Tax=Hyalella azteca TaxID=294128 RepID=A0A8B7PB20_HYAAZ|nr:activating transcription factor 7-interacting protein 2 [Hyalella azteca]